MSSSLLEEKVLKVVLLEDDPDDAGLIVRTLKKMPYNINVAVGDDRQSFLELLDGFNPDLILSDYAMPGFSGREALEIWLDRKLPCPFILISGIIDEASAESIAKGASTFVLKSTLEKLPVAIEQAMREKRTEEELITKTLELEKRNKDLELFTFISSHELKTPVVNLKTLLGMIEERGGVNEECLEIFNKSVGQVARMESTIKTLNTVLAIKNSLDIPRETVNLNELMEDVLVTVEPLLTKSKAILECDYSDNEWVDFPRTHLNLIFQNLISNAIKYAKEDQPPLIKIKAIQTKSGCCISVQDNGRGIDLEAYGHKLFGLFQRFHLDTEGSGVGLYTLQSIVQGYGGDIVVESVPGMGATFKVYI